MHFLFIVTIGKIFKSLLYPEKIRLKSADWLYFFPRLRQS